MSFTTYLACPRHAMPFKVFERERALEGRPSLCCCKKNEKNGGCGGIEVVETAKGSASIARRFKTYREGAFVCRPVQHAHFLVKRLSIISFFCGARVKLVTDIFKNLMSVHSRRSTAKPLPLPKTRAGKQTNPTAGNGRKADCNGKDVKT